MNRLLSEIYHFFLSYDFASGLQKAFGIAIPVIILALFNVDYKYLTIAGYASLTIGIVDEVAPYRHKVNELIITLVVTVILAYIYSSFAEFNYEMIIALALIMFVSSFIGAFGDSGLLIGIAIIFTALFSVRYVDLEPFLLFGHYSLGDFSFTALFAFGAISYTIFALLLAKIFEYRILRHNLSNIYFLLSKYLGALSSCYRQNNDLEKNFKILIDSQSTLLEELQLMRDLLFRYEIKTPKIHRMVNELLWLIDAREIATSPLQEFITIRDYFPNTDIQIFFRDAFSKAGHNLEDMGRFTLKVTPTIKRLGFKAELRALEYELELLKRQELTDDVQEVYQILAAHYRKVWSLSRLLDRLRGLLLGDREPDPSILDRDLSRFLSKNPWTWETLKHNLPIKSDYMRYGIRTAVAMGTALFFVKITSFLSHGFWIAFTLMSLMRPGFSVTRERSRHRILGTVIGCIAGGALLALTLSPLILCLIVFLAVAFNNGLSRINNPLSVAATTLYVLVLLNIDKSLSFAEGFYLSAERIIDTIIAAAIAVAFSYFLPFWEKRSIPTMISDIRKMLYEIADAMEKRWITEEVKDDVEYKFNLRRCQTAIVTLSNSINRMQDEPKEMRSDILTLSDDLMSFQSILAQLSYIGTLLDNREAPITDIPEFREIFVLIKARMNPDNLVESDDSKPFDVKELKPLIWMLEPK